MNLVWTGLERVMHCTSQQCLGQLTSLHSLDCLGARIALGSLGELDGIARDLSHLFYQLPPLAPILHISSGNMQGKQVPQGIDRPGLFRAS